MSFELPTTARLCGACGLCCNGVMFHTVKLQPGDSAKALSALGLKLKRKKGHNYILQPCPAHQSCRCSIYAQRPERCRLFECRQLTRVAAGEITETAALEKIHEAQRRVQHIEALLQRAGKTDVKRPLYKRYEKVMAQMIDASWVPETAALRAELTLEMGELNALLDGEFRVEREEAPL